MWPIAWVDNDSGAVHLDDESLAFFGWDRKHVLETAEAMKA
jgi:hypothetical protein